MVTIGTDGFVDYVETEGQRFMLGPVSVLKLISKLAPTRVARQALSEFLESKQVMLSVDLDKMWSLLPFHRARYSSVDPFMGRVDRNPLIFTRERNMSFASRLARIEEQLAVFGKHTASGGTVTNAMSARRVASLQALVGDLREAATAPDARTAGLPPEFLEQQKKMKEKSEAKSDKDEAKSDKDEKKSDKEASYDTFTTNMSVAEGIIEKVAASESAIDRLVTAGKRFNSVRAKADLHKIASKVAEIASDVDLAQSWVGGDLKALDKQASAIHTLFVPKG